MAAGRGLVEQFGLQPDNAVVLGAVVPPCRGRPFGQGFVRRCLRAPLFPQVCDLGNQPLCGVLGQVAFQVAGAVKQPADLLALG